MRSDILEQKDQILQWISENKSKAFISKELGCKQETLNRYLEKMGIDYAGNQSGKGQPKRKPKMDLEDYLENSTDIQTNKIRKKILEEHIKAHRCECCGRTTWLDSIIPLELHHINGNNKDNRLENILLLCPNCHALTDSYRGKNNKSKKKE